MYSVRVRGCDGDDNAGMGVRAVVTAVSGGVSIWVVHVVQVLCLITTTC